MLAVWGSWQLGSQVKTSERRVDYPVRQSQRPGAERRDTCALSTFSPLFCRLRPRTRELIPTDIPMIPDTLMIAIAEHDHVEYPFQEYNTHSCGISWLASFQTADVVPMGPHPFTVAKKNSRLALGIMANDQGFMLRTSHSTLLELFMLCYSTPSGCRHHSIKMLHFRFPSQRAWRIFFLSWDMLGYVSRQEITLFHSHASCLIRTVNVLICRLL